MAWIRQLSTLSTILGILTTLCFFHQFLYLLVPFFKKPRPHKPEVLRRYAIVIAARNEELVLPHLLRSIREQDYPQELLTTYVIADNCTDNTAQVALSMGARVVTRFHPTEIGKGYALQYFFSLLGHSGQLRSYDAFLIFDADNVLARDYVRSINRTCGDGYPVFCGYRNTKNFGANWLAGSYGLMFLHLSAFANRARMLLGSCCIVSGTGFGFTTQLLEKCGGWNFLTLTEDTQFSTWCAANGIRIGYCHDAVYYDEQPVSFRQSVRQRTRWAQGGIQVSLRHAGDYVRGIRAGGATAYACFELATLSMWGCLLLGISSCTALTVTFLTGGLHALLTTLLNSVLCSYLSLLAVGVLTLATQWRRIPAAKGQMLKALAAYPVFMMSFVPIALAAPFRKFQWKPIAHTAAVSMHSLEQL